MAHDQDGPADDDWIAEAMAHHGTASVAIENFGYREFHYTKRTRPLI